MDRPRRAWHRIVMGKALKKRREGWRGWAAWLTLPALLFIALVPRGYMPDSQALERGVLALTLCRSAVVDNGPLTGARPDDHWAPCPFSVLPGATAVPSAPSLPGPGLPWLIIPMLRHGASIVLDGFISGLGARGPPL